MGKTITPVNITETTTSPQGDVALTLREADGTITGLTLSPAAQSRLLEVLLGTKQSAPPTQPQATKSVLKVVGTKSIRLLGGEMGLELFLENERSLRICFEDAGVPVLQAQLTDLATGDTLPKNTHH